MEALLADTPFQRDNVAQWPELCIQKVKPWFRLASVLGEGENGAVYSLGPTGQDLVLSESDSEEYESETSSTGSSYSVASCSSSHKSASKSCGEEEEEELSIDEEMGTEGDAAGDDAAYNEEEVRVMQQTPMGRLQIVAKEFRHLDDDVGYVVWDETEGKPIKWFVEEEECHDYMRRRRFTSPRFHTKELAFHEDVGTIRFSDFYHESVTSMILSKLVDHSMTPHITQVVGAVEYKNKGYLLMERISGTMDDLLNDERWEVKLCNRLLQPGEIASLFFQTLFGLLTAQRVCNLKHHDLHTGNIFLQQVKPSTVFNNIPLAGATHFHYHLDGTDYYIPNCGLLAKLGDFAMASYDVFGKRAQRVDMDAFNDDPAKWGYWNATYQGERGYDTQFLFADVPVDGRHRKCGQLHKFLKTIKTAAMGKKGKVTPKKARPIAGYVSNSTADAIIQSVFGRRPLPFINFLTRPVDDAAVIVTLGNTSNFTVR